MSSEAPELAYLHQLQLFRTTLGHFLSWKNFEEVVKGCYVRVLLEMRSDDGARDSPDHYYVARVTGVQDGPEYSGFAADGATTRKHIVIELPPCFRPTKNGNVLELNSISNSPFRQAEYTNWVSMAKEGKHPFPSIPQLQFRIGMLKENKEQAMQREAHRHAFDPAMLAATERDMRINNMCLPRIDQLPHKDLEDLQEIERSLLELISNVRVVINERTKCMMCRSRLCTEVCYPCKHQVLCKACAANISGKCPVLGCDKTVTMIFQPFCS